MAVTNTVVLVNSNAVVRMKLTPTMKEIVSKKYGRVRLDTEGYYVCALWRVMRDFGPNLGQVTPVGKVEIFD